jgi:hypothetical protein
MGLCAGLPANSDGVTCSLGTAFDYGVMLGQYGALPVPSDIVFNPVNLSTNTPVDRMLNIYGMIVGALVSDVTSDTVGTNGFASWDGTSMASFSSGLDACLGDEYCELCSGYREDPTVPSWMSKHWCGTDTEYLLKHPETTMFSITPSLEQSLSILVEAKALVVSYGTSSGLYSSTSW